MDRTLFFCHGWGRDPLDYMPMITSIAQAYGARVVAPFIYGNHSLRPPPRTLREYVSRTREILDGVSSRSQEYCLVGHSTGASVALCLADQDPPAKGILALNPLFPTHYRWPGFIWRGIVMNGKHIFGRSGNARAGRRLVLETGGPFLSNALRDVSAMAESLHHLASFRLEDYGIALGQPVDVFVRIVYGNRDEFFRLPDDLGARLRTTFRQCEIRVREGENSHEWCLVRPESGAAEISDFLQRVGWAPKSE